MWHDATIAATRDGSTCHPQVHPVRHLQAKLSSADNSVALVTAACVSKFCHYLCYYWRHIAVRPRVRVTGGVQLIELALLEEKHNVVVLRLDRQNCSVEGKVKQ